LHSFDLTNIQVRPSNDTTVVLQQNSQKRNPEEPHIVARNSFEALNDDVSVNE